jgi:hypothetical protein
MTNVAPAISFVYSLADACASKDVEGGEQQRTQHLHLCFFAAPLISKSEPLSSITNA